MGGCAVYAARDGPQPGPSREVSRFNCHILSFHIYRIRNKIRDLYV